MRTISTLFLAFLTLFGGSKVIAQDNTTNDQEKVVERLTVKNIEVPVRVLDGKNLVTDLTKEDFILTEGKDQVDINGFFIKRKIMRNPSDVTAAAPATPLPASESPVSRTFVLTFQVTTYNEDLEKALNYLFDKILRPTDQLMVFANNSTRTFKDINNPQQIKAILIDDFRTAGEAYRNRLSTYVRRIEDNLKMNDFTRAIRDDRESDTRAEDMIFFLDKYLGVWEEYKKMYLLPNMDVFYNFSRYLEHIKGEKWVLNFYQFEIFPRIRIQSELFNKMRTIAANMSLSTNPSTMALGRRFEQTLQEIYINLNMTRGFPLDEITKLFYKVDATFHSFFIRTQNPSFLQDYSYQTISTELEQLLGSITEVTGGRSIVSNNLAESLDTVIEMEDVYYILTFKPKNPDKAESIKIRIPSRKGLTLLYDDNFRADYINEYFQRMEKLRPQVKLEGFSFANKILSFKVGNFIMQQADKKNPQQVGRLAIRIRLLDQTGKSLFDETKGVNANKAELSLSIPAFKNLPDGDYSFLIDVLDQFSGLAAKLYETIRVK